MMFQKMFFFKENLLSNFYDLLYMQSFHFPSANRAIVNLQFYLFAIYCLFVSFSLLLLLCFSLIILILNIFCVLLILLASLILVQVYCTHTAPDYSLPWQKQRQYTSTGRHVSSYLFDTFNLKNKFFFCKVLVLSIFWNSFPWCFAPFFFGNVLHQEIFAEIFSVCSAFIIGDGKLLTNAHCVEHATQVIL